ncbi:MAG: long-chain fatty acid--CoA ligase [Actinomycetota bacterium]|nr:long-chain fatty acid--CoA ligase [Actinomycetota bacterium]
MAVEVERATRTKTIASLWGRAKDRSGTAYLTEKDGSWEETSWPDAADAVDEIANGLLALGVRKGDALGILGRTKLEWVLFDWALASIGAIGVGIYPSLPPKDCAYVLDHSDSVGVLVENDEQRAKIDAERDSLPKLQHVLAFDELDALRARGREFAADNPDALEESRSAVGEDDLFTYIYTSGTTGPPKGCMIKHRNYYSMVAAVDDVPKFIGTDDLILLYLPLAHNFGRCLHLLAGYVGCTLAFCPDPTQVGEFAVQVKPTVLPSVPRVFEKVHTAVQTSFDEATGLKRRLIDWALRVGKRVSELEQAGKPVPAGLAAQHRIADRLVYSKVKAKLGGRLRLPISGGAPLAKEIAEFFHTIDILICEGYGQTECTTASNVNMPMPAGFRFGTVGPAIPGIEVRTADDGEVLVRGPNLFAGYYKDEAATREVMDEEGWLHTGDVGSIDDGFLTITDRKKDIIVTAGGKNVSPQNIENELKASKYVSQALVIGDRRPFLTALITLDEAARGLSDAQSLIQEVVDEVNRDKASFEQVKRFAIPPRDFTAEDDEVTPTLKLKRKVVGEHFADEIEALYVR